MALLHMGVKHDLMTPFAQQSCKTTRNNPEQAGRKKKARIDPTSEIPMRSAAAREPGGEAGQDIIASEQAFPSCRVVCSFPLSKHPKGLARRQRHRRLHSHWTVSNSVGSFESL
jgi:hypothetical protein